MAPVFRIFSFVAAALLVAACSGGGANPPVGSGDAAQSAAQAPEVQTPELQTAETLTPAERGLWPRFGPSERVCEEATPGFAACSAWVRTDIAGIQPAIGPSGYHPSDLQTAYALKTLAVTNGKGIRVAIVDAFDDPNAASDLAVYRAKFGLPPCTVANGCFSKVKFGSTTNVGWAEEESLDVDMVSAICPNCKIMLVEAASNSISNLTTAEDYALAHANYSSNSWSGNEFGITSLDAHYQKIGKVVTAATGDSGFNPVAQWPAILPGVVGVGGTSLLTIAPRTESAWMGAGSGCSKIYAKPSFQTTIKTGCTRRAQADVSADADPNTGVAVYDSFHVSGWLVFGGTSASTPMIASVYALAGNTDTLSFLYAHATSLNDVRAGKNGTCGIPLCTSGIGWDGPTGMGTPKGIGAF